MRTLGSVLDDHKGIGHGFDFLRITLAISVLLSHSFRTAVGESYQFNQPPFALLHESILPMFFALSGFLITGSAIRLKLTDFILNRAIRIVPALAVDIFIASLLIGPLFTVLPLSVYFSSSEFFAYFANIVGFIHFNLPGVFKHNPMPAIVNGSLWTVPFEIGCYVLMSCFIRWKLLQNKRMALLVSLLLACAISLAYWSNRDPVDLLGLPDSISSKVHGALHHFFSEQGNMLYIYFLAGSLFYLFRKAIPYSPVVFAAVVSLFLFAAFDGMNSLPKAIETLIYVPMIVYIMAFIGVSNIPRLPFFHRGDYSYGIYLYGYPIQQTIVVVFPWHVSPWLHFALSLPLVTLVAMMSWHGLEKPILGIRRKFSFTARKGDAVEVLPKL